MRTFAFIFTMLFATSLQAATCEELGYNHTEADCPNGGVRCPAEPEKMFCCNVCGDMRGYIYDETNCQAAQGLQLAGIQCGGKWTQCRECGAEYRYNKENCRQPRSLAGPSCAGNYTKCVYASGQECIPTAGYIYYSDGSCNYDYDDSKQPIGIIFDPVNRKVIAFNEANYYWTTGMNWGNATGSLKQNVATAITDYNSEGNTDAIIAFAQSKGFSQPAAEYCANKKDFDKKWAFPAAGDLNILYQYKDEVKSGLDMLNDIPKQYLGGKYWSSSERDSMHAWVLDMSSGIIVERKDSSRRVRCVFSF